MVGNNGLTENVINEVNLALDNHELIKVRVSGQEREDKKSHA
jgi:RNA-binding protein